MINLSPVGTSYEASTNPFASSRLMGRLPVAGESSCTISAMDDSMDATVI
jgi:hypothetical protein